MSVVMPSRTTVDTFSSTTTPLKHHKHSPPNTTPQNTDFFFKTRYKTSISMKKEW